MIKAGWYLLFSVLVLLSLSTGITKLVQFPAEMALFRNSGFSDSVTIVFGFLQTAGGLMLIWPRSRKYGSVVMATTFLMASFVVLKSGMMIFFFFSLLFIILATLPFWPGRKLPGE